MLLPSALGFSPHPPVSVYGTGTHYTIAAFLGTWLTCFPTLFRSTLRLRIIQRICLSYTYPLGPVFPFPARAFHMRPYSSDNAWYRNLNLLSIAYVLRPVLRPRLTQGRSALPWKPWIFGREDSHLSLATQSGILFLSLHSSFRYCFVGFKNAPLPIISIPQLRCRVLAPDIFGAGPLDQ